MAPEIHLRYFHGPEVHWWSTGVFIHEMVRKRPFADPDEVCCKSVQFPLNMYCNAVSILQGFLAKDVRKRLGTQSYRCHLKEPPFQYDRLGSS